MENSIFLGLSRQVALRDQMDLIANNVANMSTPGYRAQNMVFTEYIDKPKGKNDELGKQDPLSFVLDYGQYQVTAEGPMQFTGNPTDVALSGPGYIGVKKPNSDEIFYTRAGNFQLNVNGELVTGQGDQVVDDGGSPIVIPEHSGQIKIAEDGTIGNADGAIAKIKVTEFDNTQDLEARGDGLYAATKKDPGHEAEKTRVMQGMLEGSNVKPVLEMTRMIDVLRSYQRTQRLLQSEHDRQRTMIQRLTSNA